MYDGELRDDLNYPHSLSNRILVKRVNAKKHFYILTLTMTFLSKKGREN